MFRASRGEKTAMFKENSVTRCDKIIENREEGESCAR